MKERENKIRKSVAKSIVTLMLLLSFAMIFPTNTEAAKVKLNKKTITLLKGKTYTLKVKGTKKKATWKTSKKAVIKLQNKKKTSVKIKAIKAGKATISAKIGKKTYKCKVTVVDPQINKTKLTLNIGQTEVLKVIKGTGAVQWKSGNTSVAAVDNMGRVIARKAGNVKITAIQNKKTMVCTLTVKPAANTEKPNIPKEPETNSENEEKPSGDNESNSGGSDESNKINVSFQTDIFTNYRSQWECSCGYPTWGQGFKTEDSKAFDIHDENHLLNEEPSAWRVNTLQDYVCTIIIKFTNKEEYEAFSKLSSSLSGQKHDDFIMAYCEKIDSSRWQKVVYERD